MGTNVNRLCMFCRSDQISADHDICLHPVNSSRLNQGPLLGRYPAWPQPETRCRSVRPLVRLVIEYAAAKEASLLLTSSSWKPSSMTSSSSKDRACDSNIQATGHEVHPQQHPQPLSPALHVKAASSPSAPFSEYPTACPGSLSPRSPKRACHVLLLHQK